MRKPIQIGKLTFDTKKDALEHFKQILNSYNFGEILNAKNFNDVCELLKIHEKSKDLLICTKVFPLTYRYSAARLFLAGLPLDLQAPSIPLHSFYFSSNRKGHYRPFHKEKHFNFIAAFKIPADAYCR